jgi:hypothetical protein
MAMVFGAASFLSQTVLSGEVVPGQLDESALNDLEMPGQLGGLESAAVEPLITATTLTYRSHSIAAGGSAGNLEGNACPATYTMISGSCHPGYNDRVIIINQYPNRTANTWRCGFKNNNTSSRTVWIYTLCGR